MSDIPRLPEHPLEIEIDPDDERLVDPSDASDPPDGVMDVVTDGSTVTTLADRGWEAPEADTLDQEREAPLDDER